MNLSSFKVVEKADLKGPTFISLIELFSPIIGQERVLANDPLQLRDFIGQ